MAFDTVTFWLFFPIAWLAWRALPFHTARTVQCGMSLIFYGWWDVRYVVLIVASAALDYSVGGALYRSKEPRWRRALVGFSVAVNLGLLGFFKYTPLAVASLGSHFGFDPHASTFALWVVPVGISFFTFQTMAYTIDLYRRQTAPAESFRDFLLYVSFFPQLVAGPIVRARTFLPQLGARSRLSAARVRYGAYRCVEGLFLKVVVADGLAPAVIRAFDMGAHTLSPMGAWYAATLFGAQVFADFAGYTGIAIGIACLMGLRFPENFKAPYLSRSLSEFWTRWHISLSSWLRDYLYVPLGGNRRGATRTCIHLAIVMLLGGLWHGAAWNFVVWGALHGGGLIVARLYRRWRVTRLRRNGEQSDDPGSTLIPTLLSWSLVFLFIQLTWVYFRAQELSTAWTLTEAMLIDPWRQLFGLAVGTQAPSPRYLLLIIPIVLIHVGQAAHEFGGLRRSESLRAVLAGAMVLGLFLFERNRDYEFIYFQF